MRYLPLLLLLGCTTTNDAVTFAPIQDDFRIRVITYNSYEEIREARGSDDTAGFAQWRDGYCEIHVHKFDNPNTFWLYAGEWGHELGHCVYGNFHNGPYRGMP